MYINKVVLPLLLTLILISGCSQTGHETSENGPFSELKTYIKQINDVQRRKAMLSVVSSMENNVTLFEREQKEFAVAEKKLLLDYDTDREALDREHKKWVQTRLQIQKNLIDINFDLKKIATEDEWIQITAIQAKVYADSSKTIKDN